MVGYSEGYINWLKPFTITVGYVMVYITSSYVIKVGYTTLKREKIKFSFGKNNLRVEVL